MTERGKDLPEECQSLILADEQDRETMHEQVDRLAFQLERLNEILDETTERMFLPIEPDEIEPLPVAPRRRLRTDR